jgi:hypothetical protein
MEGEKESFEEKAKRLLKLKITEESGQTFLILNFQSLGEDIPVINYLVKEGCILEKGKTVEEFHYKLTPYGRKWAKS